VRPSRSPGASLNASQTFLCFTMTSVALAALNRGVSSSDGLESLRESERLIAYTDAVVAIAQTLLILPLMDAAREVDSTREFFNKNHSLTLTFFLSFYVITIFWMGHDRLFSRVKRLTQWLVLLNFAWLLTVIVLPIATILTKEDDDRAVALYISIMFANRFVALFQVLEVRREPRTWAGAEGPSRLALVAHVVVLSLFGLALLLAVTTPVHFAVLGLTALWWPVMQGIKRARPDLVAPRPRGEKRDGSASFTEP